MNKASDGEKKKQNKKQPNLYIGGRLMVTAGELLPN